MTKLYLKTFILVIMLAISVLSVNHFTYSYFTTKDFNHINQFLTKGTFSYLQEQLAKIPQARWTSTLKKLQPKNIPLANIVPIESLKLSKKNKARLLNGSIVITKGEQIHYSYFLYYGLFETYSYQRIGQSQFALQLMLTEPVNQVIKGTIGWMIHIAQLELKTTSQRQWPRVIKKLQTDFGVPMHIIPSSSDALTKKIRQDLKIYSAAFAYPKTSKSISTVYFPTENPNKLLVIGPIQYRSLFKLFNVEQNYYFIILLVVSVLIVIFLTWLLSRNVRKIYRITERYSNGDFNSNIQVRSVSTLHGIYKNVTAMGHNLKRLIQSQQNMTRFVAHEIRTPLSTMQFALDALKKEKNLSDSGQQNLNSIQEDIQEINQLVAYFLLYYKTTAHELKPKYEFVNICNWLNKLVKKYESSKKIIQLKLPEQETLEISCDPDLLKHVINNLITNALKFAETTILISLEIHQGYVEIHVEDDGPGIPASEMKTIFEPFATLNAEQNLSKHIGLGLTIAKSIVDLHKGTMMVSKSKKMGGAKLSLRLKL